MIGRIGAMPSQASYERAFSNSASAASTTFGSKPLFIMTSQL